MKSFLSSTHWLRYITAQRVASQVAERSFLWKIENPQPSISATLFDSSTLTSWQNTCWLITKSPELFSLHRHLSGSKSTQICLEPSTNLRVGAHKSWETLTQRESIEWGHVDSGSHRGGGMKGHSLSLGKYLKLDKKYLSCHIICFILGLGGQGWRPIFDKKFPFTVLGMITLSVLSKDPLVWSVSCMISALRYLWTRDSTCKWPVCLLAQPITLTLLYHIS